MNQLKNIIIMNTDDVLPSTVYVVVLLVKKRGEICWENWWLLLDSSTIIAVISRDLINNIYTKSTDTVCRKTKGGTFMTEHNSYLNVKIPELKPRTSVTWQWNVYCLSSQIAFNTIGGRYLLEKSDPNLGFSIRSIEGRHNCLYEEHYAPIKVTNNLPIDILGHYKNLSSLWRSDTNMFSIKYFFYEKVIFVMKWNKIKPQQRSMQGVEFLKVNMNVYLMEY